MHICTSVNHYTSMCTQNGVSFPYLKAKSSSHHILIGSNDGDILQDDGVLTL